MAHILVLGIPLEETGNRITQGKPLTLDRRLQTHSHSITGNRSRVTSGERHHSAVQATISP